MDKVIALFRKIAFKIVKEDSFLGKIADKLLTKEMVLYIIFGVLTTAVNLVAFWFFNRVFESVGWEGVLGKIFEAKGWEKAIQLFSKQGAQYLDSNVIAWVIAVVFAYITNKLLVFESKSWQFSAVCRELTAFVGARLFSFFVEMLGLFLMVTLMDWNEIIAKIITGIIVVIINYVFSKLFIFRDTAEKK